MDKTVIEIPVAGGEVLEVEIKDLGDKEVMYEIYKILVDELSVGPLSASLTLSAAN